MLFSGGMVYAATQWLVVVLIAKLGSPAMVGTYALAFAIAAPIFMFCDMRLRTIQASDAKNANSINEYLIARAITSSVGFLAVVGVGWALGYRNSALFILVGVAAAKVLESISDVAYGSFQRLERPRLVNQSLLARSGLTIALFGGILYLTRSLIAAIVGLCIASLILLATHDMRHLKSLEGKDLPRRGNHAVREKIKAATRTAVILRLLARAAPMGVVGALGSALVNVPRYFLEVHHSRELLGYFAAIAYFAIIPGRVVISLGEAAVARLSNFWVDNVNTFAITVIKLTGAVLAIGIGGIVVAAVKGKVVIQVLYRPEYAEHSDLLVLLMMYGAFGATASWLSYVLTAIGCLKWQMGLAIGSVTTGVILSALLIPTGATRGAGMALMWTSLLQLVGSGGLLWFYVAGRLRREGSPW